MRAIEGINKIREFFFQRAETSSSGHSKIWVILIGLTGRSNGDRRKLIKTAEMVRAQIPLEINKSKGNGAKS